MTYQNEESAVNHLECITIEPAHQATHAVIWLHGLGADANDFVPIIDELRLPKTLNIRFVFPFAPVMPVSVNQGYPMPAWFDIYSERIVTKIDIDGILKSTSAVQSLMEKEMQRGIAASNILLAGFSQGALIALTAGLNHHTPIAGVIALSGYLPAECLTPPSALRQTPIFIAHGTQDTVVPFSLGESSYNLIKSAGYAVDWQVYPMAHTVCAEEILDIGEWIARVAK